MKEFKFYKNFIFLTYQSGPTFEKLNYNQNLILKLGPILINGK